MSKDAKVAVPYIKGDKNGELTSAVVEACTRAGLFDYVNCDADFVIEAEIVDYKDENIGFRYDRRRDGQLRHEIIPTETRITATLILQIREAASSNIVIGPTKIHASVEFDHDFYSIRNSVNVFSLGQLTDFDDACEISTRRLYKKLADNIVDYLVGI